MPLALVSGNRADFNTVPAGFDSHRAADIIEMYLAAAALGFDPTGNAVHIQVAAGSFQPGKIEVSRNVDDKFA
jgi:hypothetical protein